MKRRKTILFPGLIALLLALTLSGCRSGSLKTIEQNGRTYLVDQEKGSVQDSLHEYSFTVSPSGIRITYPNGAVYAQKIINGYSTGSWETLTAGTDLSQYSDPKLLIGVINEAGQSSSGHRHTGQGILLILLGIFLAVWPQAAWYLHTGWRFKEAEPSDLALGLNRGIGILAGIIGIILLFV